ncbi:hypothetical protein Mth01_49310 [Sphaerimonospora thailandensis]|uniref:Uncharacterized protein n=1 Tax=Sphaerimonospora thailandensis TaxID=795644 RepID=A0A8J3W211_9ACTN|nr:hypothetical protein Mth01_49310 [Sphaerimonospora thailandensis]
MPDLPQVITTKGSDRYHASEDCLMWLAGRRGSESQGNHLHDILRMSAAEARNRGWTPCPGCVG